MAMTVPKTDEEYINQMYDAKKESTLRTLQTAYDKNVSAVDSALSGLGTSTYEAKRQAAGDAAITRQRLNEQFAANGLNTGAVGQANLALLNQKAANLNAIELKRVEAENQYNAQKAALAQEYQNQVKNAILENDAGRAEALYKAWKEQQAALASGGSGRSGGGGRSSGGSSGGDDVWGDGTSTSSKVMLPTSSSSVDEMIRGLETIGTKSARANAIEQAYKQNLINKSARDYLMNRYTR